MRSFERIIPVGAKVLVTGLVMGLAAPASGFTLFGIHLWGEKPANPDEVALIDPLPYRAELQVNDPDEDRAETVAEMLAGASNILKGQDKPAMGRAGLLSSARGDYERILNGLYAEGYYGGTISITVDGREAARVPLDVRLPQKPLVKITVTPGRRYNFAQAEIAGGPAGLDLRDTGFVPGAVAKAPAVGDAADLAVRRWRAQGYPKAKLTGTEVTADHGTARIAARIAVDRGRSARLGQIRVVGTQAMDSDFVAYLADLESGAPFDLRDVQRARERLRALDVFRTTQIIEAETIAPDGTLDLEIRVSDRPKLRRFGVGVALSTLDGLSFEGFWLHRNIARQAQRLRFDAKISRISRTGFEDANYMLGAQLTLPGRPTPRTDFTLGGKLERETLKGVETYSSSATAAFATGFTDRLSGNFALIYDHSRSKGANFSRRFTTFGLDAGLIYDARNNPLDPTRGYYLAGNIYPLHEFNRENTVLKLTGEARGYLSLDADSRFVLAGRVKAGSLAGASREAIPYKHLFFAGGGGSVRGFAYKGLGVEDALRGGLSSVELSAELRARITGSLGVVGFVDAGRVDADSVPDITGDYRFGAGIGLRYETGFGPLRLDLARAIDRRGNEPEFGLYLGLGQAF